jgi:hypothetical protein
LLIGMAAWGLFRRWVLWALLVGGVAAACGSSQDLDGGSAKGGSPATGGAATGGTRQIGNTNPANAVQLPDDYYTSGPLHGYCYTVVDSTGSGTGSSTISPPCGDGACFSSTTGMCIAGTTAISTAADGYASWGAGIGCHLNQDQALDGGVTTVNTLMVSATARFVVALYGTALPTNGVMLGLVGSDTSTVYCYTVPPPVTVNTPITVPLTWFNTQCWSGAGVTFDPTTMPIVGLQFQVWAGSSPIPYDICLSQLTIS